MQGTRGSSSRRAHSTTAAVEQTRAVLSAHEPEDQLGVQRHCCRRSSRSRGSRRVRSPEHIQILFCLCVLSCSFFALTGIHCNDAQHCTSSLAFTATMPNTARHHWHSLQRCPTLHVITGIHCMPNNARTSSQTHVRSVEMSPSLTRYSQASRIHTLECTTRCSFHESFGLGCELPLWPHLTRIEG
jgi:hypothetical protein